MSVLVFSTPEGGVGVITPSPGVSMDSLMRYVPDGATWAVVDSLPDGAARAGWVLQEGAVVVDESRIPVPDPTPLQLLEEIEADETPLSDGMTRIEKVMSLLDQLQILKMASAQYIRYTDPRIQQFKVPLELDDAGLVALFRRAAAR